MRHHHAWVLGGLLALATLTAVVMVTPLSRAHTQLAQSAPHCFWKVSSPTTVLYFVGSVHVLKQEMEQEIAPLLEMTLPFLQQAHTVVFEMSFDWTRQDAYQNLIADRWIDTDRTIYEIVSADTIAVLNQTMAELSLELAKLQRLKPWALRDVLIEAQRKKIGWQHQYGLDQRFFKQAKEAQKKIVYLETAQEAWERFEAKANRLDAMPDEKQEQYLLETVRSLKEIEHISATLIKAALACDLSVLEKLLFQMEDQELHEFVLRRRNWQWLGKLETFLQQEGAFFVVVGLGHLLGPENVLHLLTERGYAVEQF